MPDNIMTVIRRLAERLQEPIRSFFKVTGSDSLSELRRIEARREAGSGFRAALNQAIDEAVQFITGTPSTPASIRDMVAEFKHEQAEYARGFMTDLDGLSESSALARAASYARSIMHFTSQIAADVVPPLPIYPGSNLLQCGPFCYCHLEIAHLGGGDYDIFWVLGMAEHCDDCPRLAAAWNPLPVRNGKIVTGDLALPPRAKQLHDAALTILRGYLRLTA